MFVIIIWLIVLSIIAISFLAIFYNDNISLLPVLSSLSSLVATVVTVLIVQFRYIYNRKDNKLLDIIRDVLKLSSEHEKETKQKAVSDVDNIELRIRGFFLLNLSLFLLFSHIILLKKVKL